MTDYKFTEDEIEFVKAGLRSRFSKKKDKRRREALEQRAKEEMVRDEGYDWKDFREEPEPDTRLVGWPPNNPNTLFPDTGVFSTTYMGGGTYLSYD